MKIPMTIPPALASRNGSAGGQQPQLLGPDGKPIFSTQWAVEHPFTFAGLTSGGGMKTYLTRFDEAMKHNRSNALAMRRDAFIAAKLQERYLPVALTEWFVEEDPGAENQGQIATPEMGWAIEGDDPSDAEQQAAAEEMTQLCKRIPHWQRFIYNLCEACWYGRYANQLRFGTKKVMGEDKFLPIAHLPINGDKIQFDWEGNPCILIYSPHQKELEAQGAEITRTDRGPALLLRKPEWRQRFIIHRHILNDADFLENELAGGIQGVGIRHMIYWCWWMRIELLEWATVFMQRIGMGILVYYYESGNAKSKAEALAAASDQSRQSVQVWPRPPGDTTSKWCEYIEPNAEGLDALKGMIADYFENVIEQVITGKHEASDGKGGLNVGSGEEEFSADAKSKIILYDTRNMADTLTEDLLRPLQRLNRPDDEFELKIVGKRKKPQQQLDASRQSGMEEQSRMGKDQREEEQHGMAKEKHRADMAERGRKPQVAGGRGEPSRNERSAELAAWLEEPGTVHYARDDGKSGHWVTIGAHEHEGEKHGGCHVFIVEGKITKGPKHMIGKAPNELKGAKVTAVHGSEHPEKKSEEKVDNVSPTGYNHSGVEKPKPPESTPVTTATKPLGRKELANQLSTLLSSHDADYAGKVFTKPDGTVRVYFKINKGGKRGWEDAGTAEIDKEGNLQTDTAFNHSIRYSKDLQAKIKDLPKASPDTPVEPVSHGSPETEKTFSAGSEPWQMNAAAYRAKRHAEAISWSESAWEQATYQHEKEVEKALIAGKEVPAQVLAEYPHLAARYPSSTAPKPPEEKAVESATVERPITEKAPWELTREEYRELYKTTDHAELGKRGFIGSWQQQVTAAVNQGLPVPQSVIDTNADAIQAQEVGKLKSEFGADYLTKLKESAKKVVRIHQAIRKNEDGSITVRREQTGPQSFREHAKGDWLSTVDGPKVVSKALKPYKGKHDGATTGYFQQITLRDAKPAEAEEISRAVLAQAAVATFEHQLRNSDYPDLKKKTMAEHAALARKALGATANA